MRIVLDAMGSDDRPVPDVAGGVKAAREWGNEIVLVGPEEIVKNELAKHDTTGLSISVAHAPEIIRGENGQWYISSVEWPTRGVSLAELVWE